MAPWWWPNRPLAIEDLKGKRIAIPGKLTTAYLTLRLMQPDFEAVEVPFDQILDAVRRPVEPTPAW